MRRRACQPPRLRLALHAATPGRPAAEGHGPQPESRILALHLPWLATEVLRVPGPVLAWRMEGNRRLVVAADSAAMGLGVRPGQALGDAHAAAPTVAAHPEAPETAAARLQELALWALRIAPLAAPDPPDGLLVNIAGTDALTGGEDRTMRRAVAGLARLGHAARAAVAGTASAAMALARCGVEGRVPAGMEAAALAELPLHALPLEAKTIIGLQRLGLHRIGDVLAQPRAPLARRFGAGLSLALDRATGAAPEPFRSIRPLPDRQAALDFEEPLITRTAIDHAVEHLLGRLCAGLAEEGRGLRRLVLRAHRTDGGVQEQAIGTGLASRDPGHLLRLLGPRLERLAPGFGFDRITLMAEDTEPLAAAQAGLGGEDAEAALAALLDRVLQRLPAWRLRPRESHWPERAVERVDPLAAVAPVGSWSARPRPLRLLRRPEQLEAMALLPDDPPVRIRWRGRWVAVRNAEGPERLEPEWWRDRPDRTVRDYYRVEMPDGRRLWVCRSGGPGSARWFLHGLLP
ncbi:Y-family DNA polymerase [Roseomonas populi]|uniref:DNA polymerase Y family protein n=1 Tax=Roseomonas populi TaxID=3121582 RepID=A0ABT1X281_9PROT|nr:DNA polymerase Y family protein [Roseomonas pecuniae]MCR0981834.1 DNA polymerase Y family protein [Roseomonas pecuniae]